MNRLAGKRAVVTGGGSGIGRASAIRFADEGASVLVVGRAGNTEETAAAIRKEGGIASALITDAAIEENVAEIVRRCVSEFGGLEIFFAKYRRHRNEHAAAGADGRGVVGSLPYQHHQLLPRHQICRSSHDR